MLTCIVNAATLLAGNPSPSPRGEVAPGEIVTLFGTGFGAASAVSFDGLPAPILYTSDTQINAVVPFGIAGPVTFATVSTNGESWGPVRLPVADAVPGIFQTNSTGSAAALNQDGSGNSISNPAQPGTAVALFLTGLGRWNVSAPDGSLGPLVPPFPAPVLGVSAQVDAISVPVLYAGQAPGLILGAAQVNILIPENAPNGIGYVSIYVGNYVSQSQLWVK